MDLSFLAKLVDTSKLGGWVRAGVGAALVWAIAKWPALNDVVGDKQTQMEIAVAASSIVVGIWSHFAKSVAAGQTTVVAAVKNIAPLLAVFVLAGALVGCSSSQLTAINTTLDKYDLAVNNFNAAASRISTSIALTSQSLAGYCSDAKAAGQNLTSIVNGNDTALTALNTVTTGITTYCAAPPQDVGSAVVSLTAIIAAAKTTYQAAKGG